MVNDDFVSARDNWNTDTTPQERRDILRQIGYEPRGSTEWSELPKHVRDKLQSMYGDTLYPDETMELESGQDYHCNPGEVWVPSYHTKNGKFVHGYCRKK